jgi:cell pole-organizing protein PopZ
MGMAVTRTTAEEFGRLAQECRGTAQTLSTEQARAEMLAMADVCDRVAAQQTHGTDLSKAGAPAAQPAAQPQQSVARFRSRRAIAEMSQ